MFVVSLFALEIFSSLLPPDDPQLLQLLLQDTVAAVGEVEGTKTLARLLYLFCLSNQVHSPLKLVKTLLHCGCSGLALLSFPCSGTFPA